MLLIANGAPKSGSSWLFLMLRRMGNFLPPPKNYLNPDWANPSIAHDKLLDCLENLNYQKNNYLCKNHLGEEEQRNLILSYPNVFVVGVTRDIRDVVVSWYYHLCNYKGFQGTFEEYYWKDGKTMAENVIKYNQVWDIDSPNVYISSYEKLMTDLSSELHNIGYFLGVTLDDEMINLIAQETDFNTLKNKNPEFYRKGIIGDWQNHLDDKMLQSLATIRV